jgi:hypothetical protein
MTLGQYSQGRAGCSTSVGVGRDNQGTYVYNPSNPDEKYRGASSDPNSDQYLAQMARNFQDSQIRTWEYQDQDVYGIRRFLLPGMTLGAAYPNADKELSPPTKSGEMRPCCVGGGGGFLALRNDHGRVRFHAGVDYIDHVGEPIYAPMSGWIERIKNPGRPGLSGLLIRNEMGYSASIYYVDPTPEIKRGFEEQRFSQRRINVVSGKTIIGYAQNLHPAYPAEVPQHVHVTLTDRAGNPIAPDGKTRINKTPQVAEGPSK